MVMNVAAGTTDMNMRRIQTRMMNVALMTSPVFATASHLGETGFPLL
jgi:hypothetical protein